MEVQPQLVLLQKTLLNIEGLGRELYPELDLWTTGQPYLERWMRERMSPKQLLKNAQAQIEQLPHLAGMTRELLERMSGLADRETHERILLSQARDGAWEAAEVLLEVELVLVQLQIVLTLEQIIRIRSIIILVQHFIL